MKMIESWRRQITRLVILSHHFSLSLYASVTSWPSHQLIDTRHPLVLPSEKHGSHEAARVESSQPPDPPSYSLFSVLNSLFNQTYAHVWPKSHRGHYYLQLKWRPFGAHKIQKMNVGALGQSIQVFNVIRVVSIIVYLISGLGPPFQVSMCQVHGQQA